MKYALIALFLLLAGLAALYLFGPREPVSGPVTFRPSDIGDNIDAYLFAQESRVPGIVRGAQKHVRWHDPARRDRTRWALVYLHGFSATSHEIRPVPGLVAEALGANVFYTRLAGHGRDGAALADASVPDWMNDVAQALEIGRRIGERVIVIGTSTGGTLATLAAFDGRMNDAVAGLVLVSPNFSVQAPGAALLTLPFARTFVPLIAGRERMFVAHNPEHGKWWTTRYPTLATLPMAAAVKAANALPFEAATVPALFVFSDADKVVSAARTRQIAARWGDAATLYPVQMGAGDDPSSHVVAGDILSPGQTRPVAERILLWINGL